MGPAEAESLLEHARAEMRRAWEVRAVAPVAGELALRAAWRFVVEAERLVVEAQRETQGRAS